MRFTRTDWRNRVQYNMSLSEVIASEVSAASYDVTGAVESVQAELNRLLDIVGLIADELPAKTQQEIATHFYGVKPEDT